MAHIKIGETLIKNVSVTDSGDLLGIKFMTSMTLSQLEDLFTPATSPEFRIVNDAGEIIGVYKNRKLITLCVDVNDADNVVNLALLVTPAKIKEVELLTNQVNEQNAAIEAQAATNNEQAAQIAKQAAVIESQANEIENLKGSLNETQIALNAAQEELTTAQTALTEAQETNAMLMDCVLEMSEVVYA